MVSTSAESRFGSVFLVTGPSAAGKSTVALLLAGRFEHGVCLEGDVFRRSIVTGRHEMAPEPSADALEQLRLRYRIAAFAADEYAAAGFAVVLEDVVAGPLLTETVGLIRPRPLHLVVLLPSVAVVGAREAARETTGYARFSVEQFHRDFVEGTPRTGLWLDTSEQEPEQTVDEIVARATEAAVP